MEEPEEAESKEINSDQLGMIMSKADEPFDLIREVDPILRGNSEFKLE